MVSRLSCRRSPRSIGWVGGRATKAPVQPMTFPLGNTSGELAKTHPPRAGTLSVAKFSCPIWFWALPTGAVTVTFMCSPSPLARRFSTSRRKEGSVLAVGTDGQVVKMPCLARRPCCIFYVFHRDQLQVVGVCAQGDQLNSLHPLQDFQGSLSCRCPEGVCHRGDEKAKPPCMGRNHLESVEVVERARPLLGRGSGCTCFGRNSPGGSSSMLPQVPSPSFASDQLPLCSADMKSCTCM